MLIQQHTGYITYPFAILESILSPFLCCHGKLRSPPWVHLYFDFSLLVLLAGDVSLNPIPSVCGLCLGAVNVRSMRYKAPGLPDLGITETWPTTNETSADLAKLTPQGFSFFHEPRALRKGGEVGLFVSSAHKFKFSATSLPTQTSFQTHIQLVFR